MRRLMMLGLMLGSLAGCAGTPGSGEEQTLVDRATLSVQEILGDGHDRMQGAPERRGDLQCERRFAHARDLQQRG